MTDSDSFPLPEPIDVSDLLELLAAAQPDARSAIVFDADGTLWSGDVGEEMFEHAIEHRLLKPEALPGLHGVADDLGLPHRTDANEQARDLFAAFKQGTLPELTACELMAWCYAGYSPQEFRPHIVRAMAEAGLQDRYFEPLKTVTDWARNRGLSTVVVSASPAMVVVEAVAALGFSPEHVAGGQPVQEEGKWQPRLQYPLPYAQTKVDACQNLLQGMPLLAAFGDNVFDFEMLSSAIVQVAVRPKAALSARLYELANCRLLA